MFGEIVGLWLAQAWSDLGRPRAVRLVELGPGRGTLMADLLARAARVDGLSRGASRSIWSSAARGCASCRPSGWRASTPTLARATSSESRRGPAAPGRQRVPRRAAGPPAGADRGGLGRASGRARRRWRLAFVPDDRPSPLAGSSRACRSRGTVAEVSPARAALAHRIGEADRGRGRRRAADRLRRLGRRARPATPCRRCAATRARDPLATPGEADLSAQVDFRALAEAARAGGAAVYGPVPQGDVPARARHRGAGAPAARAGARRSSAASCARACSA